MAKPKKEFVCSDCGCSYPQWVGKCPDCKAWNTLEEVVHSQNQQFTPQLTNIKPQYLSHIDEKQYKRIQTGFSELDKTLGGGLVDGSVVLIGGDPGIGKSTLVLQCLANINPQYSSLYISGEESESQIAGRAKRLNISEDLLLLSHSNLEQIFNIINKIKPKLLIIDSIQTMTNPNNDSLAGSVSQVRDCAAQLTIYAKQTNTTVLMIGHVTKDGALAGPRILEHMVDSVLYFEGDAGGRYRIVRAVKNRFGAVNEISVFAMLETGLSQVENPSAIFISGQKESASGSVITITKEGSRPLLIELQALVNQHNTNNPVRICVGVELNRLLLLLAILHKHTGINTYDKDVFINIVGGIKVSETASDLSLLLAIISSIYNQIIPTDWVSFGEVGLTGEIRPVYNGLERLKEAQKHGFKLAIIPQENQPKKPIKNLTIIALNNLSELLKYLSNLSVEKPLHSGGNKIKNEFILKQ